MPKFGRKFVMGLLGTMAIAVVGYVGSEAPAIAPLVPWIVSAIAGVTGLTAASIAYEDGKHAEARASIEVAQAMVAPETRPAEPEGAR